MEKMKNFTEKHVYVFIVGCTLVYTLLNALFGFLIGDKPGNVTEFYCVKTLTTTFTVALMAAAAFFLGLVNRQDFGARGLGKGLFLGLPFLALFFFLYSVPSLVTSGQLYGGASFLTVPLLVVFNFTVGVSEEITCRGILFNALRNKHGDAGKGLLGAVLLSSFIFGVMHFGGMIGGTPFTFTIAQVLSATFAGVFFCGIYVRAGSLLPVIVVHALFNIFYGLKDILSVETAAPPVPAELPQAEPVWSLFIVPMIVLVFALYGLFLIRKRLRTRD